MARSVVVLREAALRNSCSKPFALQSCSLSATRLTKEISGLLIAIAVRRTNAGAIKDIRLKFHASDREPER
ncbi:hypothetical protein HNQ72_005148 [Rhizobium wenxiniae]|uniref:Uncharacterized protein n=2 Tax=Rhizobium wenxiniae TaxID=1737357 RepID=A0A7W9YB13_9HYPH|nr:hypothetical protein [Rhizobium wenxiniae]